jgi:LysR family transcriptional regulator, glycine cleavage system transcriptional activator
VAARCGSFVRAGAELGVTAAAVSQQVRLLETHLGKQLFLRQGNRVVLTDAGRLASEPLARAMADLRTVAARLRDTAGRPRLVLSVLPSVAELWLVPQLARLSDRAGLDLRVEADPVTFGRGGADLRLTSGREAYPGYRVTRLAADRVGAFAAPSLLPPGSSLDDLAILPDTAFIHTAWGPDYASGLSWPSWFDSAGFARKPDPALGLRVNATRLALGAAEAGVGVTLAPGLLASHAVTAGRLVAVGSHGLAMTEDYVLVHP